MPERERLPSIIPTLEQIDMQIELCEQEITFYQREKGRLRKLKTTINKFSDQIAELPGLLAPDEEEEEEEEEDETTIDTKEQAQ